MKYQDVPDSSLIEILYRAYSIGKMRYLYMLNRWVFDAAYYTKASCWSYEEERRMLVRESETRTEEGLMLIDIPKECITALICGTRTSPEIKTIIQNKARQLECKYFEMKIGRNSIVPFFIDSNGDTFVFNKSKIKQTGKHCVSCKEPLPNKAKKCSWCKINESHKIEAAKRNIFRDMSEYGLLEDYIRSMEAVTHGTRKSK